jgi:isopenicillin N synthase-like dioxygenase
LANLEADNGELLQDSLVKHSFAVLTDLSPQDAATIHEALRDFRLFFDADQPSKESAEMGPSTEWDFGYIGQKNKKQPREQFHCVVDSLCSSAYPWPKKPPSFREVYLGAMHVLESVLNRVCDVLIPTIHQKWRDEKAMKPSLDLSIMDTFFYPNVRRNPDEAEDSNSPAHCDPGLFTVGPFTAVPGFQVFDQSTQRWLDADEEMGGTTDLLIICNEYLQQLSDQRVVLPMYKACTHRVSWSTQPRVSMMYERRYELEVVGGMVDAVGETGDPDQIVVQTAQTSKGGEGKGAIVGDTADPKKDFGAPAPAPATAATATAAPATAAPAAPAATAATVAKADSQ